MSTKVRVAWLELFQSVIIELLAGLPDFARDSCSKIISISAFLDNLC